VAGIVITVIGVALGYWPGAGVGGVLAALAMVVVFSEPETLPRALEAFVDANPISGPGDRVARVMEGDTQGSDIASVLVTGAALTAVFAPLTTAYAAAAADLRAEAARPG
jgi:ABC-2 type transport system permease protein